MSRPTKDEFRPTKDEFRPGRVFFWDRPNTRNHNADSRSFDSSTSGAMSHVVLVLSVKENSKLGLVADKTLYITHSDQSSHNRVQIRYGSDNQPHYLQFNRDWTTMKSYLMCENFSPVPLSEVSYFQGDRKPIFILKKHAPSVQREYLALFHAMIINDF